MSAGTEILGQLVDNPAKYLPPIVGVFGGFIPLLIFAVVSDLFVGIRLIAIAFLAIIVWLGYLLGPIICAYIGFSEWLTVYLLLGTLVCLLLVVGLRKCATDWDLTKPISGVALIIALSCLALASTNQYALMATTVVHVMENAKEGESKIAAVELMQNDGKVLRVRGSHVGSDCIMYIPSKIFDEIKRIAVVRGQESDDPSSAAWKSALYLDSTAFVSGNIYRWPNPPLPKSATQDTSPQPKQSSPLTQ